MELDEQHQRRLQRAAYIAANATWEGDISGFAFGLLSYAGLDLRNGYLISSENHLNDTDKRRTDIMVEVMVGRQKVLVIECKKDMTHPTKTKEQLRGYMQGGNFPHGIIMYPLTSTFYSLDTTNEDASVEEGQTLSNTTDYEDILNLITNMRIPDLENI
jgi:hypothetical protein